MSTQSLPEHHARRIQSLPRPLRFTRVELSGSLGDPGTFLPLAVAITCRAGLRRRAFGWAYFCSCLR